MRPGGPPPAPKRDLLVPMRVAPLHLPPPSCLAPLRTSRAESELRRALVEAFVSDEDDASALAAHRALGRSDASWVSTRDELEAWRVGCPCGEDVAKLYGVAEHGSFGAPIFLACAACKARALLFDRALHGYDACTSTRKRKPRPAPDARVALHCRACKESVWRPAVVVTYQGDADNYERRAGKPRLREAGDRR